MADSRNPALVYWHRALPPLDAEVMDEHTVKATSGRVSGRITHRDELWERCYRDLMRTASDRLGREVARLGGDYAHVLSETVDSHHDPVKNEAWLAGRFDYVLYRKAAGKT